jgi:hypothetical protein
MVGDRAAVAAQQPRRAARGRPPGDQRHPLAVPDRLVLAGCPERYGPRTTLYNRFTRWRAAGVWDLLLKAVSRAYGGDIVMIDGSCVRVHQHGAADKRGICRSLHGTFGGTIIGLPLNADTALAEAPDLTRPADQ